MKDAMIVAGIVVREDGHGRFSLNDLHRASGGLKANGPSYWLAIEQAKALCAALRTTGIPVVTLEGRNGGTFVVRELVYAYTMWIDADFHLKVIRTFDALVRQKQPSIPQTLAQALRLAADQADQIEQQQAALAVAEHKADAFERIADSSGSMTIREAAKDLGVPPGVLGDWLKANRWIYKQGRTNLAFEPRINAGLMVHKVTVLELEDEDGTPRTKSVSQPRITPKGLAKLALEVPGARS